jgi:outer membrane usher protein
MFISAFASMNLSNGHAWSSGVSLVMPLGNRCIASVGTSRDTDRHTVNSAEVSQSTPVGPGLGWRLRGSDDRSQQGQGSLVWNTNVGSYTVDANEGNDSLALQLGASGSIGLLKGLPFATRNIGYGSFAVVKVGDLQDVPVYLSNQLVATTNGDGMALVPTLLPYQKNQLTIDPAELPFDIEVGGVKEMSVPYARSGVFVNFPVRRTRNALVVLLQPNGEPVPTGTRVTVKSGERRYLVGKRDLGDVNQLTVQWQGGACRIELVLDPKGPSEPRIGPLICGEKP